MGILQMCFEFFKTGLFSIGGGLATLPFLYRMADQYSWFSSSQLSDMIAVSESTPGPMGVNMATYAGFSAYGIWGALLATFSLVFPSIVIIIIISKILTSFQNNVYINSALYGIRPASVGLISSAAFGIFTLAISLNFQNAISTIIDWKALILGLAIAIIYYFRRKWHPIIFILLGAVGGVVFSL